MRHSYKTKDTCSSKITFDLDDGIVRNIEFSGCGGCDGNLKAIQKLVDGFTVKQITTQLGGILCGRHPTSYGDQLAKAIQKACSQARKESGRIV
jgi:uncharacterized protein (TIGR03905 family)